MVFFFTFNPPKRPKKLTHACLPKIWIDPYIWQAPSNVLITGWEDLALNAGALPIKMIDPYFWQTPSNVLVTGLEEEEPLHISGKRSIFLAKLRGSQKMASLGPKNDFFSPRFIFFSRVQTLDSWVFLQNNAPILVKYSLQSLV